MSIKYRVHYFESERGWGQDTFTRDFDSREEAQKAFDACNAKNTSARAPDYYSQARRIEVIDTELKP